MTKKLYDLFCKANKLSKNHIECVVQICDQYYKENKVYPNPDSYFMKGLFSEVEVVSKEALEKMEIQINEEE